MGPWLTKAGKAPVALGPKDEIPKAVEKLQKEIAKKRKEDSPILRFLGSNLLTRSSFYEDDKEEIEMMLLYELPEGNLEKFLWQRWLTLTGHEAFIGACQQLARGCLHSYLFCVRLCILVLSSGTSARDLSVPLCHQPVEHLLQEKGQ